MQTNNHRFVYSIITFVIFFTMLAGWSAQSHASLIHDIFGCQIDVNGNAIDCTTPLGSIEFPTESGGPTIGSGGIFFDYTFASTTFDENDIQGATWLIDPTSGILTDLDMRIDTNPLCLGGGIGTCNYAAVDFLLPSGVGFPAGIADAHPSGGGCDINQSTGQLECASSITLGANIFTARQVPEPYTLALMGLGLVGLGFRRKF